MEGYSTVAFVQAFIRFSCEVGYPQFILIDQGTQLVKGCESMRLKFTDIKNKIHKYTMEPLTHIMLVDTVTMAELREGFDISRNHQI